MQEVETTRTIKVGCTYRIHPTEAWLGIDRGFIKVLAIDPLTNPPGVLKSYIELNEEGKAEYASILSGFDEGDEDYKSLKEELDTKPWVTYEYTSFLCKNPNVELGETYMLPLFVFQDVITQY